MTNINIYSITYGTQWKIPCRAVVAAKDSKKAEGLLERAVREDERVDKIARKNPGLVVHAIHATMYGSNKEGVIYFG